MNRPTIIVAMNREGLIGFNGTLPWKKKADLQRFKRVTMGGALIMGRKTWDSIGRPLPGRRTLVLSRSAPDVIQGIEMCSSLDDAFRLAGEDQVWIAGGASVYVKALPFVDRIDLTLVDEPRPPSETVHEATYAHFLLDAPGFRLESEEVNPDDPSLIHRLYLRKSP